jgi:hypothetical protein
MDDMISRYPGLRQDRLNSPSSWPGFKEFIAAVPPERGQPVYDDWSDQIDRCSGLRRDNIESFEDHIIKALFYAAFHFPETSAGGAKVSQSFQDIYTFRLILSRRIDTSATFDYRWRQSTAGNSSSPGNHCVRWL